MGGNLQYEMQGCIQRRVNNLPRTVPCSPLIKGNVSRGAPWPAGVLNCVCRSSGCSLCKSFHCIVVRSSISSCCSLVHVELKPVTSKKKKNKTRKRKHMGQSKEQGLVDVITQLQTAEKERGGRAAYPSWSSLLQIQRVSTFLLSPVPRTVKQGRKQVEGTWRWARQIKCSNGSVLKWARRGNCKTCSHAKQMVSFPPWTAIIHFFQNKFSSIHVRGGITFCFLHTYLH